MFEIYIYLLGLFVLNIAVTRMFVSMDIKCFVYRWDVFRPTNDYNRWFRVWPKLTISLPNPFHEIICRDHILLLFLIGLDWKRGNENDILYCIVWYCILERRFIYIYMCVCL